MVWESLDMLITQVCLQYTFTLTLASSVLAQTGVFTGGEPLGGSSTKLFGEHKNFTANLEMIAKGTHPRENITLPGRLAYSEGKSRFEMDLSSAENPFMAGQNPVQMRALGLDKMAAVSRPDKRTAYVIYPGLAAYAEQPLKNDSSRTNKTDSEIQLTETGRETIDGHPTIRNRAIIHGADGKDQEATVWNATDLSDFPVKIEQKEGSTQVTLLFSNIKLVKPDDSLFEPPPGFTRYESLQALIQGALLKRLNQSPPTAPRKKGNP